MVRDIPRHDCRSAVPVVPQVDRELYHCIRDNSRDVCAFIHSRPSDQLQVLLADDICRRADTVFLRCAHNSEYRHIPVYHMRISRQKEFHGDCDEKADRQGKDRIHGRDNDNDPAGMRLYAFQPEKPHHQLQHIARALPVERDIRLHDTRISVIFHTVLLDTPPDPDAQARPEILCGHPVQCILIEIPLLFRRRMRRLSDIDGRDTRLPERAEQGGSLGEQARSGQGPRSGAPAQVGGERHCR